MAQDNVTFHLSTRVQSLAHSNQKRVIVTVDALSHTTASSTFESDHVFSALPAPALAALLPPEADTLATQLRSIGSVDMGVVRYFYTSYTAVVRTEVLTQDLMHGASRFSLIG